MATEPTQPLCAAECGRELQCPDCNDSRPTAEDVYAGWQILSPFGRWETVERAEQANQYAPVMVWTKETGPDVPWSFPRWRKLNAIAPPLVLHGKPEVRVVEYEWRDGPMYAVATSDTFNGDIITGDGILVQAFYERGTGWTVTERPDRSPSSEGHRNVWPSKARARAELRRLAREYAKKMGVPMRIQPPRRS